MYQLYHSKEEFMLEVKPLRKIFKNLEITDEIIRHNEHYYFCNNKKLLRELAVNLKEEWIKDAENAVVEAKAKLNLIRNMTEIKIR